MIIEKWDGHFYDPMNPRYLCECSKCLPIYDQKKISLEDVKEFLPNSGGKILTENDVRTFAADVHYQIMTANMTDDQFEEWFKTQTVYPMDLNLKAILLSRMTHFRNRLDYACGRMQELKDELRDERRKLLDIIQDNEKWIEKIQSQLKEVAPQIIELLKAASSLDASSEKVGRAGGGAAPPPPPGAGS